jgi:hypothetical protein
MHAAVLLHDAVCLNTSTGSNVEPSPWADDEGPLSDPLLEEQRAPICFQADLTTTRDIVL